MFKSIAQGRIPFFLAPAATIIFVWSCGQSNFAGSGAKFAAGTTSPVPSNPTPGSGDKLQANFNFTLDGKTFTMSAAFSPKSTPPKDAKDYKVDYTLIADSLTSTSGVGFPPELAAAIAASGLTASVTHSSTNADKPYSVAIVMSTKGIIINGEQIGDKNFALSQAAINAVWDKQEGDVATAKTSDTLKEACKIKATGLQPKPGEHSTFLTMPADCDFKLPTIMAGYAAGHLGEVPIGTYWRHTWVASAPNCGSNCMAGPTWDVAHQFPFITDLAKIPLVKGQAAEYVKMDNGFMLAEPSGKVYLLADAGIAQKRVASYRSADKIAGDMIATLKSKYPDVYKSNFQALLQPVPGSAADNYAASTVFSKGSVIALYDDTPDMGGTIDVATLTLAFQNVGLTLNWDAKLVAK